jgi:peptide/nickel transport system substrate-binding protein
MTRFKALTVLMLVAPALAVGLAACGGNPTPKPEPTAITSSALATPTVVTGAGDASTLVFGHPEDATKLDPADITDSESLLATWQIYDGLTRYKSGTTEIEPALAESWTTSEDGLTWTFTLRDGVTFQDGEPFNADAVVWNFNRWFDKENPAHKGDFEYWANMFQGFKGETDEAGKPKSFFVSAEAVDPKTVKITLNRPNAPLLQTLAMGNFAFASPKAVEQAGDKYGTPDGNPIAVGTGPYKLDEWKPGEEIRLTAYDGFWGTKPPTANIVLRVIPDGTQRFLSLQKGEIDAMNQVNPEDIEKAKADSSLQVVMEPANNVGYLGFNLAKKPWDNKDCRLAVYQAIDKKAIVDALYAGDAQPASEMMPPGLWGYNKALADYPYDPAAAKKSLEACVKATGKLPAKITMHVPPIQRFYFPKPKELGEAIQAGLSDVGITTEITSPDWKTVYLKDVSGGNTELHLLGWGGDNGDPDNFLCQLFCGGTSQFNSSKDGKPLPADKALDELLRKAAATTDQAQRQQMYEQANQIIHDLVLAVPLSHRSAPLIFRSSVSGYTPSPLQQDLRQIQKQ